MAIYHTKNMKPTNIWVRSSSLRDVGKLFVSSRKFVAETFEAANSNKWSPLVRSTI